MLTVALKRANIKKTFLDPAPGKAKKEEKLLFVLHLTKSKAILPILGAYNKMFKHLNF